jgi:hypothetical protein
MKCKVCKKKKPVLIKSEICTDCYDKERRAEIKASGIKIPESLLRS